MPIESYDAGDCPLCTAGERDRRSRLAPQLNLQIRAATANDRAFIETLGKRTAMDSVSSLRRVEPPAVLANFERLLAIVDRREHLALIAEADGVRVGFMLASTRFPTK